MSKLIYVDTETTGLDPNVHQIWEMAYAVDNGAIRSSVVPHSIISADAYALEVGDYEKRSSHVSYRNLESELFEALKGNTLVCANPAFDAGFLRVRWGSTPWNYRLFDIEAYAMGALGYYIPKGLKNITDDLRVLGYTIPEPDHSAAGDVATLRACHLSLVELYQVYESKQVNARK